MGPWPWQVSLDTAGTALGGGMSHTYGYVCRWNPLFPLCQWGDPDSREC